MKKLWQIFSKGLIAENPIFILALSLCPALAVTTSVINGLTMGLTVTFVITTNNVVVSLVRNLVNPKVRVPVYITSIATIVTVAQLILQAYFPELYKALGIYLALVVVFAIILARAEVFASKNSVIKSFCDGFGMGCGFTLAMLIISCIRELIGAGTIAGVPVFGAGYNPMLMMVLPPGAFILIGYLVAATKTWNTNQERKARLRELKAKKGAEN
ncbi:MAG: electron transport complex subunit E [Selenomonadales bacterium]|nr:electron transport complex subunit E [Selenomonadales bacterium]MDD7762958.1 electron transport complex subunit E [Selenomonadales bacterium]